MYFLVIQTAILSILFIFMVHNIIYFFKDNLTIPKTKDLVSLTEKKYEEIYNVMKRSMSAPNNKRRSSSVDDTSTEYGSDDDYDDNASVNTSTTFIDALPSDVDMKEELKNFLRMHQ